VIDGHVVYLLRDAGDEGFCEGHAEERAIRCNAREPTRVFYPRIEQSEAKSTKDVLQWTANAQHFLLCAVGFDRVVARVYGSANNDLRRELLSTTDHVIEHR
jgi:hypothetical protein